MKQYLNVSWRALSTIKSERTSLGVKMRSGQPWRYGQNWFFSFQLYKGIVTYSVKQRGGFIAIVTVQTSKLSTKFVALFYFPPCRGKLARFRFPLHRLSIAWLSVTFVLFSALQPWAVWTKSRQETFHSTVNGTTLRALQVYVLSQYLQTALYFPLCFELI